jgi:hypothetical protein
VPDVFHVSFSTVAIDALCELAAERAHSKSSFGSVGGFQSPLSATFAPPQVALTPKNRPSNATWSRCAAFFGRLRTPTKCGSLANRFGDAYGSSSLDNNAYPALTPKNYFPSSLKFPSVGLKRKKGEGDALGAYPIPYAGRRLE